MGYFAKINQQRQVIGVIEADEAYIETLPGTWIETSIDGSFRKNYAGIGYSYDYALDCFIPPKTSDSATFYPKLCQWRIPTPVTGSI